MSDGLNDAKRDTTMTGLGKSAVHPLVIDPTPNLLWARQNDPIVAAVLDSGGDSTDCVIALVEQKQELFKRIMELENIAPRKIKVGDQTLIWRCPDSMVPDR